jgi:hypothetical protein
MSCRNQGAQTSDVGVVGAVRPLRAKTPVVHRAKGVNTCSNTLKARLTMGETGHRALPTPGRWRHQTIRPIDILDSNLK